jgi:hypothetical protein
MVTGVVLVFWYRQVAASLLAGRPLGENGAEFARKNRLESMLRYEAWRAGREDEALVRVAARDDYRLLQFLLRNGFAFENVGRRPEVRFLRLHFGLVELAERTVGWVSGAWRRAALEQRVGVVSFLASAMGDRLAFGEDWRPKES